MKTQLTYVMAALAMCAFTVAVPLAPEGSMAVRQAEGIDGSAFVYTNNALMENDQAADEGIDSAFVYNNNALMENDQAVDAEAADADAVGPKGNDYLSYSSPKVD